MRRFLSLCPTHISATERIGARARDMQEVTPSAWQGIVGAINSRVDAGAFGLDFSRRCEEGSALITGNDETTFAQAIRGEIPDLEWPLRTVTATHSSSMFGSYETEPYAPATSIALDLVEFCWRHVAQPDERSFHSYYSHAHLDFERESGRQAFGEQINRIFARNGLAYELRDTGTVERLAAPVLHESLRSTVFHTGDDVLDGLIETARHKFLSHDPNVRRESLEKLWDGIQYPANMRCSRLALASWGVLKKSSTLNLSLPQKNSYPMLSRSPGSISIAWSKMASRRSQP